MTSSTLIESSPKRLSRDTPASGAIHILCLTVALGVLGVENLAVAGEPSHAAREAFDRGEAALRRWALDDAIGAFDAALRLDKKFAKALAKRAVAWARKCEVEKAVADADAAVRLDARVADIYCDRSEVWYTLEDYDRALAELDVAVKIAPRHALSRALRGRVLGQQEKLDEALAEADKAAQLGGQESDVLRLRGDLLLLREETDAAMEAFDAALKVAPKDYRVLARRAIAWADREDFHKALADANEAIQLAPASAWAFLQRAVMYQFKSDFEQALRDCDEALRLNSRYAMAYYMRAAAKQHLGDFSGALQDYRHAKRLVPKMAGPSGGIAVIHSQHQDLPTAIAELTEGLRTAPENRQLLKLRALFYVTGGETDKAVADLSSILRRNPKDIEALHQRAGAWQAKSDTRNALNDLTAIIKLDRKRAVSYFDRGEAHHYASQYEKAIADYSAALERDPTMTVAYARRADAHARLKNRNAALQDVRDLSRLAGETPHFHSQRAKVHLLLGDFDQAAADLKQAIRLNLRDVGATYQPPSGAKLSEESLRHGHEQVRRMLKDRPKMAEHVGQNDSLWTWAARKFAGEDTRTIIFWDPLPSGGSLAEHVPPVAGVRGAIRVNRVEGVGAQARELSFEELWASAVFELHNITHVAEFVAIERQARQGKLNKIEYIRRNFQVEELAIQQTRAFYATVFLPWAKAKNFTSSDPEEWIRDWRDWLAMDKIPDTNDTRTAIYSLYYDLIVVESQIEQQRYESAIVLLNDTLTRGQLFNTELRSAWTQRLGDCYGQLGKHDLAVKAYTQAHEIDPTAAAPLVFRARMLMIAGDPEQARRDFAVLKRMDPVDLTSCSYLAYMLATHPDERARDGKKAVILATRACELAGWERADALGLIAAACAEAGQRADAVRWQTKCIERIGENGKKEMQDRLALYEAGKAYRDPWWSGAEKR
jgi:tetratricopeptide (TPR) repeat protein